MFANLVSYTVSDYEPRWIDVVVLEKVAEIVAQEINADTGTDSVDANALVAEVKNQVLGDAAATATAVVLDAQTGQAAMVGTGVSDATRSLVAAGMGVDTQALEAAAHSIAREILNPVQAEAMVASSAEAEQGGGVSSLSTTVATQVAARLGVGGEVAALSAQFPDAAPPSSVSAAEASVAAALSQQGSISIVSHEVLSPELPLQVLDATMASNPPGAGAPVPQDAPLQVAKLTTVTTVTAVATGPDDAEDSELHRVIQGLAPTTPPGSVMITTTTLALDDPAQTDTPPDPANRRPAGGAATTIRTVTTVLAPSAPGASAASTATALAAAATEVAHAAAVAATDAIAQAAGLVQTGWRLVIKRVLVWVEKRRLVTRLQENAAVADQLRELKRAEAEKQDEKAYLRKIEQKHDAELREEQRAAHKHHEEEAQAQRAQSLRAEALNAEDRARAVAFQARAPRA